MRINQIATDQVAGDEQNAQKDHHKSNASEEDSFIPAAVFLQKIDLSVISIFPCRTGIFQIPEYLRFRRLHGLIQFPASKALRQMFLYILIGNIARQLIYIGRQQITYNFTRYSIHCFLHYGCNCSFSFSFPR